MPPCHGRASSARRHELGRASAHDSRAVILLDTNVLIYAYEAESPFRSWARDTIAEAVSGRGAAIPCGNQRGAPSPRRCVPRVHGRVSRSGRTPEARRSEPGLSSRQFPARDAVRTPPRAWVIETETPDNSSPPLLRASLANGRGASVDGFPTATKAFAREDRRSTCLAPPRRPGHEPPSAPVMRSSPEVPGTNSGHRLRHRLRYHGRPPGRRPGDRRDQQHRDGAGSDPGEVSEFHVAPRLSRTGG